MPRDFSTISPSAKSLLIMKAGTSIPLAREAADLLWGAQGVAIARAEMAKAPAPSARTQHFVDRYGDLDDAVRASGATQILEIAAGFSFRGLALTARDPVFYFDTDLPEIAATKADLVAQLHPGPLVGTLRVGPLDALDPTAFRRAIGAFPPGPVTIIHEGLLVYLDDAEKARLAANVWAALRDRGGRWITADVYVRRPLGAPEMPRGERARKFLEEHRVEENKFAGWREAEDFFTRRGFAVEGRRSRSGGPSVRETWVLRLA